MALTLPVATSSQTAVRWWVAASRGGAAPPPTRLGREGRDVGDQGVRGAGVGQADDGHGDQERREQRQDGVVGEGRRPVGDVVVPQGHGGPAQSGAPASGRVAPR